MLMLEVHKILVPIEFHEATLHVIGAADCIARRFHSGIVLLHVIAPESYSKRDWRNGHPLAPDNLISELFSYAETELHEKLPPDLKGLAVKCIVRQGDASTEIVAAAKDEAVDLIVMPTRGRKGFYGHLIGSVATKVMYESDRPVLTGTNFPEVMSRGWTVKHVLCGVTFSQHSVPTLRCAAAIAAELQAKLTIAHITPDIELYGPGGMYADRNWQNELVRSSEQLISRLQTETGASGDVAVESGDPGIGLNKIAQRVGADLLVVGCHFGGGHFGVNSYGILAESQIPVLSV
jgi:nucleotide-binding universal stress UspA family protein